jgi:SAM-dependent methyltransferase
MSDMNRSFSGSMPEFYDRFLVPVMFEPFARDLTLRLKGLESGRLLELAAGTGIVIRAMTKALPRAVDITATDVNPAMLEQAKLHSGLAPGRRARPCMRIPKIAAIDSDRNQPSVPNEASRAFR